MSQENGLPSHDWKSVAALVATETDPDKLLELARALIAALDENSSPVRGHVASKSRKSAA